MSVEMIKRHQGSALGARVAANSVARQVALALVGSLLVALAARLAFYLPGNPVPVTAQTLAVLLVGAALGRRLGTAALLLYVAEGAIGLPVFAPGGPLGLARLLSPTGGYLAGFVAAAWIVGALAEAGWHRRLPGAVVSFALGAAAILGLGTLGLLAYLPAEAALVAGLVAFLPGEALKVAVAALVVTAPSAFRR